MTINQLTHEIIGAAMEVHRMTNRRDAETRRQRRELLWSSLGSLVGSKDFLAHTN